MKTFKNYLNEKMGDYASEGDFHPEAKLGPKATQLRDKLEIKRQKQHLSQKASENHKQSDREGGGGAAEAKAKSYENARDAIHNEEVINEDGMAAVPTNSVGGVAGTGDARLPTSQREPGVSKKHNPIIQKLARRALPKV